jgi:prepilin-type N-terminal cleavage/methylation domain-containing protein
MKKAIVSFRSKGFTLIEVLVTVVVIGVLAAVVIPAVTAQVTAGDSARVINDLNNIRTGIENFDIAVRQFPGDVDDLVNAPGTSQSSSGQDVDQDITGVLYTGTANWAGPYIEASLPSSVTSSTPNVSGAAIPSGYAATLNNKFVRCTITDTSDACATTTPDYLAIQLDNLTVAQAGTLNDLVDGAGEALSSTAGKFRVFTSGTTTAYYFATPIK